MSWREKFEQIHWDHLYILDTERCGVKQAKEERRVIPAGEEFKNYILEFCLQVEKEAINSPVTNHPH